MSYQHQTPAAGQQWNKISFTGTETVMQLFLAVTFNHLLAFQNLQHSSKIFYVKFEHSTTLHTWEKPINLQMQQKVHGKFLGSC